MVCLPGKKIVAAHKASLRIGKTVRRCARQIFLLALVALSGCTDRTSTSIGEKPLVVVASGDTHGWIVPCGCTSNQSGGLLRRGTFVRQLRAGAEVVYIDVGGAGSGLAHYDHLKLEAILRGEVQMGVAAHNLGLSEARLGPRQIRELQQQLSVPWVSCNVRGQANELLVEPMRRITTSQGIIGIVGVLSDSFQIDGIQIDPPREAILRTIHAANDEQIRWVILAYLPTAELRALASSLPEVDVVLGGPTGQSISPERAGPTLLASATSKGKFLIKLHVQKTSPSGTSTWEGSVVELTDEFADDAVQKENLDQFYADLRERDLKASDTSFVERLAFPDGFCAAGTAACRECHDQECQQWDESSHAAAWKNLAKTGADVDPYCQQCHTTLYGLPGGFVSAQKSRTRVNVGCESCHGPSQSHCQDSNVHTAYYQRASDQCLGCHDRDNSPDFDQDSYWTQVQHGPQKSLPDNSVGASPSQLSEGKL